MTSVGQMLFAFFEDYLKVQRGLRPGSIRSYRDTMKLFLNHIATACRRPITRLNLSDLSSDRVLDFLRTIEATRNDTGEKLRFTTNFFWMCQGYYRHTEGYTPVLVLINPKC